MHLLGAVEVRLVGRERAVLAVAAAGPRQRQRQVAREGDAPAHALEPLALSGAPARWRPRRAPPHYAQATVSRRPGTQVYLARHGQTAYNLEGRFQGQQPIPLDDTGRGQARELAERAVAYGFAALWCSPLLRARETADIVGERIGLEPRRGRAPDGDRRRRLDRPQLRGGPRPTRRSASTSSSPSTPRFAFPGGESFAEQEVRVAAAIADVERGRAAGARRLPRDGHPRGARDPRRGVRSTTSSASPTVRSSRSTRRRPNTPTSAAGPRRSPPERPLRPERRGRSSPRRRRARTRRASPPGGLRGTGGTPRSHRTPRPPRARATRSAAPRAGSVALALEQLRLARPRQVAPAVGLAPSASRR